MSLAYASAAANSSGVSLTASITPATASDKSVDWTVAFVNPSSAWASGKTASDYVSVTPVSDGATTATVSAVAGFGEKVKITATSRINPSATAYCTCDYGARLKDVAALAFNGVVFSTSKSISTSSIQTVETIRAGAWQGMMAMYSGDTFTYSADYKSDYTKSVTNSSYSIAVKPTTEFYNALKANSLGQSTNSWIEISEANRCSGKIYESLANAVMVPSSGSQMTTVSAAVNAFNTAVVAASGSYDFEIKVSVTTDFESKDYIFQCKFNRSGAAFTATSVALSSSSIVL